MMNFSNSMKPPHKRRGTYWRDLVLGFIVGALVALLIGLAVSKITTTAKADQDFSAEPPPFRPHCGRYSLHRWKSQQRFPPQLHPKHYSGLRPIVPVKSAVVSGQRTGPMALCMARRGLNWLPVFQRLPRCPLELLLKWKAWVNMWFRIAPPNGLLRNMAKTSLIFTLITMKKPVPSACNI